MLKGFQNFILRGNVVDLAVGVVIGAAFGKIAAALVSSFINPLIALLVGKPDFKEVKFVVNGTTFPVGDFIGAVVEFLLVAMAVYFLVVLPVNALMARVKRGETVPDPTTRKCPECLSEIPIAAHKCAFCTSVVA